MRLRKTAVGLVAVVGLLGAGGAAFAATSSSSTPAGGTLNFFVSLNASGNGPIVLTGAIGDYGQTVSVNSAGKPASNGNYVKVSLHQGGMELNVAALNKKLNTTAPTVYSTTCSLLETVSSPITIVSGKGTGLYKGITGTLNATVTYAVVSPIYKSGNTAKCDFNGTPLAVYGTATGSGTVSF